MARAGRRGLWLVLLLAVQPAAADSRELATLELAHRLPEELVPLIRPLLDSAEAVVASGNLLIIRASPEKIAEIRALVGQLDRRPHRLLITVIQGSDLTAEALNAEARLRGRAGPEGADIEIRGRIGQGERREATGDTQQVQTLEGRSAAIRIGAQMPLPGPYPYGPGVEYRSLTTGFAVTPRLSGGDVTLDIEPWSDRPSRDYPGAIDTQGARTVIRAALGEWVEVGGGIETSTRDETGLTGRRFSSRSHAARIFLKVEDLDAGRP
jgi:hypothetical protein